MICYRCQREISVIAQFCSYCGASQSKSNLETNSTFTNSNVASNNTVYRDINQTQNNNYFLSNKDSSSALYCLFRMQEIINEVTTHTNNIASKIILFNIETNKVFDFAKVNPREAMNTLQNIILINLSKELDDYGKIIEYTAQIYDQQLQEFEKSMGSFIMEHQQEIPKHQQEVLHFLCKFKEVDELVDKMSVSLKNMTDALSSMVIPKVTTTSFNQSVHNCQRKIINSRVSFDNTSKTYRRIQKLLRQLLN